MLISLYAIDSEVFATGNEWSNSIALRFLREAERERGILLAYTALQADGYLMAKFSCVQTFV